MHMGYLFRPAQVRLAAVPERAIRIAGRSRRWRRRGGAGRRAAVADCRGRDQAVCALLILSSLRAPLIAAQYPVLLVGQAQQARLEHAVQCLRLLEHPDRCAQLR